MTIPYNKRILITAIVSLAVGTFPALLIHELVMQPQHTEAYQQHKRQQASLQAIKALVTKTSMQLAKDKAVQKSIRQWATDQSFYWTLMQALWSTRPHNIFLQALSCQQSHCQLTFIMPTLALLPVLQQWLSQSFPGESLRSGQIKSVNQHIEMQYYIGRKHAS